MTKNMKAIEALARIFSIPIFSRSKYYNEALYNDFMWIDSMHARATEDSVKTFADTIKQIDHFIRICTSPRAALRAAHACGYIPKESATIPKYGLGQNSMGVFCILKTEAAE